MNNAMLEPYKNCVLVKPDPEVRDSAMTTTGIVIPSSIRKRRDGSDVKLWSGEVLKVGEGVPIKFETGLRVYYNAFDSYDFQDYEEYEGLAIIPEKGIYAVEVPKSA